MAVPIIGENRTTSDDPEFATLTDEEREQLAAMAEEHPEDVNDALDVTTAFIVFINKDGSYGLTQDVTAKFAPDRMATGDDVYAACSVALSDLQAGKSAQLTAAHMAQLGQMMQAQQQEAAIRAQLQKQNQAKGFGNL
jgi:hypothetical protein